MPPSLAVAKLVVKSGGLDMTKLLFVPQRVFAAFLSIALPWRGEGFWAGLSALPGLHGFLTLRRRDSSSAVQSLEWVRLA